MLIVFFKESHPRSFILDLLLLFLKLWKLWTCYFDIELDFESFWLILANKKWFFDLLFSFLSGGMIAWSYYVGIRLLDFDFANIDWPVFSLIVLELEYSVYNRLFMGIWRWIVFYLLLRETSLLVLFFVLLLLFFCFYLMTLSPYSYTSGSGLVCNLSEDL